MNEVKKAMNIGYREGLVDGVRRFAWWKNGVQYVGTGGKTYDEAVKEIVRECKDENYRQPY